MNETPTLVVVEENRPRDRQVKYSMSSNDECEGEKQSREEEVGRVGAARGRWGDGIPSKKKSSSNLFNVANYPHLACLSENQ